MNVSTLEAPMRDPQSVLARPDGRGRPQHPTAHSSTARARTADVRTAPARPARREGRGTGPSARPPRPLGTPVIKAPRGAGPRSCAAASPAPSRVSAASSWRLTDRAIALVVVTGLVIVTAALAVVGLTAVRVTGERYHVPGSSPAVSAPYTP